MEAPDWAWNVSDEVYYAPDAPLGSSALSTYLQSPVRFHWQYVLGNSQKETKALEVGKALHLAALEPREFLSTVVSQPESIKRRTGKKWEEFRDENAGKIILTRSDFQMVRLMSEQVRSHPEVGPMLEAGGYVEQSFKWEDERTGLACKARFDLLVEQPDGVLLVDLKTTKDAFDFRNSFARYFYHCQAAHYRAAAARALGRPVDSVRFVFAAVEKTAPFPCVAYEPTLATLNAGELLRREALDGIARGFERHDFSDPRTKAVMPLMLPSWATPDDAELAELERLEEQEVTF